MHFRNIATGLMVLGLTAWATGVWGADAPAVPVPAPEAAPVAPVAPPAPTPVYGWNEDITSQVGLSQSRFDNWAQGGEDSLAWQASFLGKAADEEAAYTWTTTLKLGFGQLQAGQAALKKTSDEISLETVAVYKLGIKVDPFVSVRGLSQFAAGYDYAGPEPLQTSAFLDPGYFTESAGFGYSLPDWFNTRVGFAMRETVTREFPHYADNPETETVEKTKVEPGLESVTNLNVKLTEIARYTSNLALFSNLKASDQIVVRWDNLVSVTLTKYVTAGLNFQLLYDKTVSVRRQLSQLLTVGLSYQYTTKEASAK
jgi:hypothetical protein